MKQLGITEDIAVRGAISAISGGAAAAWILAIFGNRVFALAVGFLVTIGVWTYDAMTPE